MSLFFKPGQDKQDAWSSITGNDEQSHVDGRESFIIRHNRKRQVDYSEEGNKTVAGRLERVLDAINAVEAKRIIFQFIEEKESDFLTEEQKRSFESYYNSFLSQLNKKKKQISLTVENSNMEQIKSFINELQNDHVTSIVVKRAIVKEILTKLEGPLKKNGQLLPSIIQQYSWYLKRLEWELKSEIRIITYTVRNLMKTHDPQMRSVKIADLGHYIRSKIKDKKLKMTADTFFQNLISFYHMITDKSHRDHGFSKNVESGMNSTVDEEKLPDFGEEEEEFLKKLEQNDNPSEIAVEIEQFPEIEKAQLIEKLGFDPRFDRYFEGIVEHLNEKDMGKLIGIVMTKLKKVEQVYGKHACEDYIEDLANRLAHRIGEDSMIVRRIRQMKLHLGRVNKEWTLKLDELKRRLRDKSVISQLAILQEMAEDPHFTGIFGTVQNMERLTVEKHFDEIFSGLPLETQKIIAENLLTDLGHLRKYYPHLIKKLEHKLETATVLLQQRSTKQPELDNDFLDTIVDFTETSGQDSIREIEKELNSLPSLKEKITTIRFWLKNNYFSEKPHIQQYIENILQSLERSKAREGGLLRSIFDHLRTLRTGREKVLYLKEKLNDSDYYHLVSTIKTLIENISSGIVLEPDDISEDWILSRLNEIADPHFKLDWLRIRSHLSAYQDYASLLQYHIEQIEAMLDEELEERLENEFYDSLDVSPLTGKEKVHENIITLTRAVLKLPGKVVRRQYIKKQEQYKPLPADNLFQRQRKLLYYILNTESDEKPESGLKVLANKVLLSFAEKREYLKLLKLSRYKVRDRIITLQDELGITDEHIAYYAVYILGCDKPSLEARVTFIDNFSHGSIIPKDIVFTNKQGQTLHQPYKEFFLITPQIIHRVLSDMKEHLKKHINRIEYGGIVGERHSVTGPGKIDESVPLNDELPVEEEEVFPETDEPEMNLSQESDTHESEVLKETGTFRMEEKHDFEDKNSEADEQINAFEKDEEEKEAGKENEYTLSSTMREREKTEDEEKEAATDLNENDATSTGDSGEKEEIEVHAEQEGTLNNNEERGMKSLESEIYRGNKIAIDRVVKERLIENGKKKSKIVAGNIQKVTEDTVQEKTKTLEERIQTLFYDLSRCFPEAIPELINQTMIPIFVEKGVEDECDILNAVNQNIFIPVLYDGADILVDNAIESIETFLNKQGIFKEIRKYIHDIVGRMKKVRVNEITNEIAKKGNKTQRQGMVDDAGVKGININAILKCLIAIEKPETIISHLQEKYIDITSGKPEYAHLEKKLLMLKNILTTSKMISWDMVSDHFGEEAAAIIERLKIKIMRTQKREESKERGGNKDISSVAETENIHNIKEEKREEKSREKGNIIPDVIEAALVSMDHFTNPHQVIQQCVAADARLKEKYGGLRLKERQYVVTTLFNAGRIFTYDNKLYIGFGKIKAYISDKHNVGYDKKKFARELFIFLRKFPTNSTKAKFLGIHESEFQNFIKMLDTWTTYRDTDTKGKVSTAGQKKKNITHTTKGIDRRKYDRRKETMSSYSGNDRRKGERRQSERRKTITDYVAGKKNQLPRLTKKRSGMLRNANVLITDKLIFFIKHYNGREPLKMLYESYLSPHAPPKNLIMLIDKNRHGAIYNAVKEDPGILDRLYFDRSKVMKLYNKKLKKVKR